MIEPLAIALRDETSVVGIWRGGSEHKVSLYADDMLLYLSDPLVSLPKLLHLLETFSVISGYKVHLEKSELVPINAASQKIT